MQASGVKGGETLGFMVDTNLIADPDIRKGVKEYLDSKKPVPQLSSLNEGLKAAEQQRQFLELEKAAGINSAFSSRLRTSRLFQLFDAEISGNIEAAESPDKKFTAKALRFDDTISLNGTTPNIAVSELKLPA